MKFTWTIGTFVALIVLLLHHHLSMQYAGITSKACESDSRHCRGSLQTTLCK
jgi:hypothetical protein